MNLIKVIISLRLMIALFGGAFPGESSAWEHIELHREVYANPMFETGYMSPRAKAAMAVGEAPRDLLMPNTRLDAMLLWRLCYFPLLSGVPWRVEALENKAQQQATLIARLEDKFGTEAVESERRAIVKDEEDTSLETLRKSMLNDGASALHGEAFKTFLEGLHTVDEEFLGEMTAADRAETRERKQSQLMAPPLWKPDESSERCTACGLVFHFFRRRHHCRLCGDLFCDPCSSWRIQLPEFYHDRSLHRVCGPCGRHARGSSLRQTETNAYVPGLDGQATCRAL